MAVNSFKKKPSGLKAELYPYLKSESLEGLWSLQEWASYPREENEFSKKDREVALKLGLDAITFPVGSSPADSRERDEARMILLNGFLENMSQNGLNCLERRAMGRHIREVNDNLDFYDRMEFVAEGLVEADRFNEIKNALRFADKNAIPSDENSPFWDNSYTGRIKWSRSFDLDISDINGVGLRYFDSESKTQDVYLLFRDGQFMSINECNLSILNSLKRGIDLADKVKRFEGRVFKYTPIGDSETLSCFRDVIFSSDCYFHNNDNVYHRMVDFILSASFNQGGKKNLDWLYGKCDDYRQAHFAGEYGKDAPYGEFFAMEGYWKRNGMAPIKTHLHEVVDFLKECGNVTLANGSSLSYESFRKSGHSRDIFDDELALTALDIRSFLSKTCQIKNGHVELPEMYYFDRKVFYSNEFSSRLFVVKNGDSPLSLESVVNIMTKNPELIQKPYTGYYVVDDRNLSLVVKNDSKKKPEGIQHRKKGLTY